ncbi:MAG: apolipoprotein N-acyltransferase [Deltaproteobacteria bacterium]|nr:apolipoprotein N-acyltransferase [Deltaproteobacteria bacterium]
MGIPIFLSIVSGILLTLAFPICDLSILAWVGLIPLFIAVQEKSAPVAFFLGWTAGIVHFTTLLHWVTVSMTRYGNVSGLTSFLLLMLLALYLGGYVGAFAGILRFLQTRYLREPMIMAPMIWILLEYLRTHLFSGFPWGLLGYSQYKNLTIIQISDITGVYGVSFIILLVNSATYLMIKWMKKRSNSLPLTYALVTVFVISAVGVYGTARQNIVKNAMRNNLRHTVHIIQGNIEQDQKWDYSYLGETLRIYRELTVPAVKDPADLIVWPETALPCYFMPDLVYRPLVQNIADLVETPIIFGSLRYEKQGTDVNHCAYFNSAYLVSPDLETISYYDKVHLVPFGEYIPCKALMPFVNKLTEGIGDFSPGQRHTVFRIPQATFGVLICYEVVFPDLSRTYSRSGLDFLVSLTNDAWFGQTGAPVQHFSMGVLRAVENRISLVRAANTGISGIIEPTGHIQARTPLFVRTILKGMVPLYGRTTFYARYGDVLVGFCGIVLLMVIGFPFLGTKMSHPTIHRIRLCL